LGDVDVSAAPGVGVGVEVVEEGGEIEFPGADALVAEVIVSGRVEPGFVRPRGLVIDIINVEGFAGGDDEEA